MSEQIGPAGPAPELTIRRRPDGDVVIGPIPAAPAGVVAIALPGAMAYLDPTAVDAPPAVVVADDEEAREVVDSLLGEGVGALVGAASEDPTAAPSVRTEQAERISRHGILQWLWTTGALPLDRSALALESAVAADAVADVSAPDLDVSGRPADLVTMAPLALALARMLRSAGDGEAWPGLPSLLDEALAALRRRMPIDHPLGPEIEHEAELRSALRALRVDRLDWTAWDDLLAAARPRAAEHAGSSPVVAGHGFSTIDWAHVPPGVVDAAEGTVEWWLRPVSADRVRLSIEVPAYRGPTATGGLARLLADDHAATDVLVRLRTGDPAPGLRFKVYSLAFPLPLVETSLELSPDGRSWLGSAEVSGRALGTAGIVVDVYGAGLRTRPRRGIAGVTAEATRWAARGLSLLRLALAAPGRPRDGVRDPLERARQLYATVAETGGQDAELATRQQARCLALTIGYLELSGETRTRRLRNNLDELIGRVPPRDSAIPDLSSAAWLPTVTERGLLAEVREIS